MAEPKNSQSFKTKSRHVRTPLSSHVKSSKLSICGVPLYLRQRLGRAGGSALLGALPGVFFLRRALI